MRNPVPVRQTDASFGLGPDLSERSILIFGGSGFIGRHLIRFLLEQGETRIAVSDIVPPHESIADNVTFVKTDIRKPILVESLATADLVINLAAIAKEPGYPAQDYFDVNEHGAGHVLDFCRSRGIQSVWFTSTMSVYGPIEAPRFEDSPLNPETPYGQSKRNAEVIHRKWLQEDPSRTLMIVRPAVIFGAGERGNYTRLARALKRGRFVYPGRRDTIKSSGYVRDLARSMTFMGNLGERELLYNFSYPKESTIQDICEAFCRVGGFRKPLATVPKSLILGIAKLLALANRTGLKGDIHPDRVMKVMRSTNIHPRELIARGFDFETNLESGLQTWYSEAGGFE